MDYLQDSEDWISILNQMIFSEFWRNKSLRPFGSNWRIRMIFFIQHFVFKTFISTNGVRLAQSALRDSRNLDFICYRTRAQKCKFCVWGSAAKFWSRLIGGGFTMCLEPLCERAWKQNCVQMLKYIYTKVMWPRDSALPGPSTKKRSWFLECAVCTRVSEGH